MHSLLTFTCILLNINLVCLIWDINLIIVINSKPTVLHSDGPVTLFSDAESFWLCLSIPLPCFFLTVHFLFHLFFCFFPFPSSSVSGPFPSFGLLVNLLAWWFCAPWPTCALWPQQMLPITVRNMPSISPLILKRLKVHLSLPPSHPFLTDANLYPPTASQACVEFINKARTNSRGWIILANSFIVLKWQSTWNTLK